MDLCINELIRKAGWYKGTETTWARLSEKQRKRLAFRATGCLIAYPTWESPVDCVHTDCRIARREILPIEKTKGILKYERESGWLRFVDPETYEKLYTAMLKRAHKTGIYDPWKLPGGWQAIVFNGIMA